MIRPNWNHIVQVKFIGTAQKVLFMKSKPLSVKHGKEMQHEKQSSQLKEAKSCRDLQYWVFFFVGRMQAFHILFDLKHARNKPRFD